jgi:hypothetical protein
VTFTDLATLLRESDYVSIHAPLTPATRHLIGADELAAMKPGAILINTARGGLVDDRALLAALRSGLGAAGQQFQPAVLQPVGVLELVHQDVAEAALIVLAQNLVQQLR